MALTPLQIWEMHKSTIEDLLADGEWHSFHDIVEWAASKGVTRSSASTAIRHAQVNRIVEYTCKLTWDKSRRRRSLRSFFRAKPQHEQAAAADLVATQTAPGEAA